MSRKERKGLGLLEIVIGAIILLTVFGGVIASFITARRWIERSNIRLNAANTARYYLSELAQSVRQDTWGTGRLAVGNNNALWAGDVGSYDVNPVGGLLYREVIVRVGY